MFHEDKRKEKQETELQNEGSDVFDAKNRSRVRETDFKSIEDTISEHTLSPFELEVKEKMAQAPSALDLLTAKENHTSKKRAANFKISLLVKQAHLPPRLQACYEFLYGEGLSIEETAFRMGLSATTIRRHKELLIRTLRATIRRRAAMPRLRLVLLKKGMNEDWLIYRLYHSKGLTLDKIEKMTGKRKSVLYEALERVSREEIS